MVHKQPVMEQKYWEINSTKDSLEGAQAVLFDHTLRRVEAGGLVDWDLFPYDVKDRSLFLSWDKHPKNIVPTSFYFKNYWTEFAKKSVEGLWVEDKKQGEDKPTWVYMMPKLHHYINYMIITGNKDGDEDNRGDMSPDLSSGEWILASYTLVCDGFSGFLGDDMFTCHRLVEKLYLGEELDSHDLKKLKDTKECWQPNGKLKIFVDPWEYLTRFYLVDNPRGNLGKPLYHNRRLNIGIFGSRGVAKSYWLYGADFPHEWTFGRKDSIDEKETFCDKLLFAMGCPNKDAINRSAKIIKGFYDSQPGKFKFPDPKKPDYMGPFYKNVQGGWEAGGEIEHIVKTPQNKDVITGSTLQISVITPDRKRIVSGDRFRRVYIEEAGLLSYLTEVHTSNKDSMEVGENKVGSAAYSGTSGEIESIVGIKSLNDNPSGYDMGSIPNYWKNPSKRCCLFLSAIYKYRGRNDGQGNNDLVSALSLISKLRVKNVEEMDSQSFDDWILNNPINLDEMLRPNKRSFLPSKEAAERLSEIDAYDYFKINATMGEFKFSSGEQYGVEFRKDNSKKIEPILEYNIDRQRINLNGMPIVYEHPPNYIPKYLYWVVYDPVSKPGQGESMDASLNSIIVYKWFYTGDESTLEDCIVAEWIGRHDQLDETYELVIKMAKYFNAMIFPETNTSGFVDWCKKNSYSQMLQQEANLAMKELNANYQNKKGKVGFSIYGDKMKPWLLQKLRGWLLRKRGLDSETGEFESRTIEHILSPRILNEIINFSEKGNFDHISSLLGLMLLLTQLDLDPPNLKEEKKEDVHDFLKFLPKQRKKRSRFEQSMYRR